MTEFFFPFPNQYGKAGDCYWGMQSEKSCNFLQKTALFSATNTAVQPDCAGRPKLRFKHNSSVSTNSQSSILTGKDTLGFFSAIFLLITTGFQNWVLIDDESCPFSRQPFCCSHPWCRVPFLALFSFPLFIFPQAKALNGWIRELLRALSASDVPQAVQKKVINKWATCTLGCFCSYITNKRGWGCIFLKILIAGIINDSHSLFFPR